MKIKIAILILLVCLNCKVMSQWTCGDTITDERDGKKYPTVYIGNQCWMAKNLNIGKVLTGAEVALNNGIIEKYCYDDKEVNCDIYGGLYMWDELMEYKPIESSQGICPAGWHVPSDAEIKQLEINLGMSPETADLGNVWRGTDEGTKMLLGGTSGFNALLGGARVMANYYMLLDWYGYYYSSTQSGTGAWRRCLQSSSSQIGRWDTYPKSYALSVRCIKDTLSTNINKIQKDQTYTIQYNYEQKNIIINNTAEISKNTEINILNILGETVFKTTIDILSCQTTTVNIPYIKNGIYIVNLKNSGTTICKKIIIP